MPSFATARRIAHTAKEMFDLVLDIEKYPLFVPLCERLVIRSRTREDVREVLIATMTVGYRFLRESFTSRVIADGQELTIRSAYLDGPFQRLDNVWRFEPDGADACQVHFSIDYEFRSRALASVMGAVFDSAFRKFADAFEARADVVYGKAETRT